VTDIAQVAALIAAGLVNNDRYLKCTRRGNYSALDGIGVRSTYTLDVDSIAKDAWAIALKIEEAERDRNR
jgi:hypothetical protein